MADSDVEIRFGASTGTLDEGVSHVKEQIASLGESLGAIGEMFKSFAEIFGAAFSAEALIEFTHQMAELGEEIERTSAMLGVNAVEVQKLQYEARMTGGSAQQLSLAMERLQLNLARAQTGAGPAAEALKALGLSARQLMSLPISEQMNVVADAVSRFADGGNKTAIVMALLGRSGAQMIPVLDQGRAGMQQMGEMAERTGAVMSQQTVTALSNLQHSFVALGSAITGVSGTLVGSMAPALTKFDNDLATVIGDINIAIQSHTFWEREIVAIETGARELGQALLNLGTIAKDVFTLNWGAIAADRAAGLDKIAAIQKEGDEKILAIAKQAHDEYEKLLIGSEGGGGNKPQAPALNLNSASQASAAEKEIDGQIKAWEQWLDRARSIYDEAAKTFSITEDRKYALTMDATNKAYEAELALLQKEEKLGDLSVQQRSSINAKIIELEAKHATDMQKINAESVASMQKEWEGYFNAIESSFNSQLRGLLAGTTSWKTAMEKMLGDVIIKFIEGIESMVAKWLAGEIAKTVATQSGVAARTAAESEGAGASLLTTIGNAIKAIFSGAGQTAAGVAANVAPAVGPAAPAVGAAAGAAVIAEAMPLVPHEVGSWEVPGITPALLHPGEMVIPQPFAEGLRANGGLGGGATNIVNISAVDAQSIANMFQQNKGIIGQVVERYVRDNPAVSRRAGL